VENTNNSPLNIRFFSKTSDVRNFVENIRSDVKTSEVATLFVNQRSESKCSSRLDCAFHVLNLFTLMLVLLTPSVVQLQNIPQANSRAFTNEPQYLHT